MERKYDWNQIKDLPVLSWVPDRYDIKDKILFRSPLHLINHLMWNQLSDYDFYNELNTSGESVITIHSYYTASVHHLHLLKTVEIPANTVLKEPVHIKNYSRLREESVHQARIENCLNPENSKPLRNYIERLHRIPNIFEYCRPEMREVDVNPPKEPAPYDRVLAIWVIDIVLGLYREDNEGKVSIVGCSDYLVDFASQLYPKSNSYWSDRLSKELPMNYANEGGVESVYIPEPAFHSNREFEPVTDDSAYYSWLTARKN